MRQPSSAAPALATPGPRDYAWFRDALAPVVSQVQLAELKSVKDEHPWTTVVNRGWTTDDAVLKLLSAKFRMRIADLSRAEPGAVRAVRESLARRYRILPLAITDTTIEIATSHPHDLDCERGLAFTLGRAVRTALAPPHEIAARTDELYAPATAAGNRADGSIIRLVDRIIAKGIELRASDVHLEPEERGMVVRFRVDGVITQDSVLPRAVSAPLVARVKIMARLDIADRLRPQDGRARVAIGGVRVDLRVSTLPVAHGEKVVIRVLDARDTVRGMEALGLDDDAVAHIEALLEAREGMIIVTGPTGSGKTTTLYSIVRRVHQRGVNVVTVEDPVEYRLNGVVQVQVNEKTGLTFPAALRSILRQDPDVILVGEIRDRETAQIAVQAALTGHLVLSTLHTIDAASAVARLTDLGVDASKTATALKGIVAQRLLRRLCRECRAVAVGAAHAALRMTGDPARVFHAVGCAACSGTGYRGRIAITEVLIVGAEVERRIASNESAARILLAARDGGMRSLWEAAVRQVQSGNTSADELLRVLERPGIAELRHGTARVARTPRPPRANAFELVDARPAVVSLRAPVLVADASPESRTSARALLEGAGVTVFEAASASETLDMLDRVAPKLVVVDTALPGLDNAAIIRRVRSHATRAFVIVVGERADDDQEAAAIESGASDFIVKPFRPRAFIARLHAIIGDHGN